MMDQIFHNELAIFVFNPKNRGEEKMKKIFFIFVIVMFGGITVEAEPINFESDVIEWEQIGDADIFSVESDLSRSLDQIKEISMHFENSSVEILVEGYSDIWGSEEKQREVGMMRATNVASYLHTELKNDFQNIKLKRKYGGVKKYRGAKIFCEITPIYSEKKSQNEISPRTESPINRFVETPRTELPVNRVVETHQVEPAKRVTETFQNELSTERGPETSQGKEITNKIKWIIYLPIFIGFLFYLALSIIGFFIIRFIFKRMKPIIRPKIEIFSFFWKYNFSKKITISKAQQKLLKIHQFNQDIEESDKWPSDLLALLYVLVSGKFENEEKFCPFCTKAVDKIKGRNLAYHLRRKCRNYTHHHKGENTREFIQKLREEIELRDELGNIDEISSEYVLEFCES